MNEEDNEGIRASIIFFGDKGVGKTSLIYSFLHRRLPEHLPTVLDINYQTFQIRNDNRIFLYFVDTNSDYDFEDVNNRELPREHAFVVICYRCDSFSSLEGTALNWLPQIKENYTHSELLLVGTKLDLREEDCRDHASTPDAHRLKERIRAFDVIETSAKLYGETSGTEGNVDAVFKTCLKRMRDGRRIICGICRIL